VLGQQVDHFGKENKGGDSTDRGGKDEGALIRLVKGF